MQHGPLLADEHGREFDRWHLNETQAHRGDDTRAPVGDVDVDRQVRLTVTVDVDGLTVRTVGDLANVLRATANRLGVEHGGDSSPNADTIGLTITPAGTAVGLWSIGQRGDSIPHLKAQLAAYQFAAVPQARTRHDALTNLTPSPLDRLGAP